MIEAAPQRPQLAGPDHPIRKMTRQIAFESGAWTPERAQKVTQLFDSMAPDWGKRTSQERRDVLRDALARGGERVGELCVEIGSGTGSSTADLARHFECVVAVDLAREMLRHAPESPGRRVQADAAALPLPDASVGCLVLVNALLFPSEMDRVLAPGGTLLWVSALGEYTPIYLEPTDVARALPGNWSGVTARAGWGIWTALRRDDAANTNRGRST